MPNCPTTFSGWPMKFLKIVQGKLDQLSTARQSTNVPWYTLLQRSLTTTFTNEHILKSFQSNKGVCKNSNGNYRIWDGSWLQPSAPNYKVWPCKEC